jgi:hypothetical protein
MVCTCSFLAYIMTFKAIRRAEAVAVPHCLIPAQTPIWEPADPGFNNAVLPILPEQPVTGRPLSGGGDVKRQWYSITKV